MPTAQINPPGVSFGVLLIGIFEQLYVCTWQILNKLPVHLLWRSIQDFSCRNLAQNMGVERLRGKKLSISNHQAIDG